MNLPAKVAGAFAESRIGDEVVLMRLDTGEVLSLTGSAAAIWETIDGRRDRDAIVSALAEDFEGHGDTIGTDVDAFLIELKQAGLIVV